MIRALLSLAILPTLNLVACSSAQKPAPKAQPQRCAVTQSDKAMELSNESLNKMGSLLHLAWEEWKGARRRAVCEGATPAELAAFQHSTAGVMIVSNNPQSLVDAGFEFGTSAGEIIYAHIRFVDLSKLLTMTSVVSAEQPDTPHPN